MSPSTSHSNRQLQKKGQKLHILCVVCNESFCGGSFSLRCFYFHLTILAIELKTEPLSVIRHQEIGFSIRRPHALMNGTPTHTIPQTMFAEHQYRIFHPFFFISPGNLLYAMFLIKRGGTGIHHISQIRQCGLRKSMVGRFPYGAVR